MATPAPPQEPTKEPTPAVESKDAPAPATTDVKKEPVDAPEPPKPKPEAENPFSKEYEARMRPLLEKYNRIREYLRDEPEIHAAQIVVIGDQSAGKSSVLESLVRVSLPRGTGVVTKVPIVIESHNIEDGKEPYATVRRGVERAPTQTKKPGVISMAAEVWESLKVPQKKEEEPAAKRRRGIGAESGEATAAQKVAIKNIEQKIREEQRNILQGRSFCDVPVYVDVYQPGVPDITLVDLPGINYDSADNKRKIQQIYKKYITPEESLILNVIPATSDIAANESCLYAKEADPRQMRTLHVLTKIDKADTDVDDKMRGLGRFVLVRNRTQDELERGVTLEEVRRKEVETIMAHPALRAAGLDSRGTDALARMLVREDHARMRSSIARLLRRVPAKQAEIRNQILSMPRPCQTESDKRELFQHYIGDVNNTIKELLRGNWSQDDDEEMHMNARLQDLYDNHDKVMRAVTAKFFRPDFRASTFKAVRESRGVTLANFIQDPVLKMIINKEVHSIQPYTEKLVDDCLHYLVDRVTTITLKAFDRFDVAGREVVGYCSTELEKSAASTKSKVQDLFMCELNGPYTVNHYYMDTLNKIREQIRDHDAKDAAPAQPTFTVTGAGGGQWTGASGISSSEALADANVSISDLRQMIGVSNDDQATFDMQCALFSYWKVVQKRMTDYIHMLVRSVMCETAMNLGQETWTEHHSVLSPLLNEPPSLAAEREDLQRRLTQLELVETELRSIQAY